MYFGGRLLTIVKCDTALNISYTNETGKKTTGRDDNSLKFKPSMQFASIFFNERLVAHRLTS